jgi:ribose transport system substrate-binding protein
VKKWSLLFWLFALSVHPGCSRSEEIQEAPRVALVLKTLDSPFFSSLRQGAEEAAAQAGLDLTVQAAERQVDVQQQMQVIESLIEAKFDALLIDPVGSGEVLSLILKANEAGIPVLILDSRIDSANAAEKGVVIETFVGSDNYQGGVVAGEFILERTKGKTNVGILEGIPGHESADSRLKGFLAALKGRDGVQILASQPANWERGQGFRVTQELLNAHPEMNVVFACNDMMALGAVEAIEAVGRSGEIMVVGFDAVEEARLAISDGSMLASVAQLPSEIGRIGIETAARILAGEEVPEEIPVQIELITRENLYHVQW